MFKKSSLVISTGAICLLWVGLVGCVKVLEDVMSNEFIEINRRLIGAVTSDHVSDNLKFARDYLSQNHAQMAKNQQEAWQLLIDLPKIVDSKTRCSDQSVSVIKKITEGTKLKRAYGPIFRVQKVANQIISEHAALCSPVYDQEFSKLSTGITDNIKLLYDMAMGFIRTMHPVADHHLVHLFKRQKTCTYSEGAAALLVGIKVYHKNERLVWAMAPKDDDPNTFKVNKGVFERFVHSLYTVCNDYSSRVGNLMDRAESDSLASRDVFVSKYPLGLPDLESGWVAARFCSEFLANHSDERKLVMNLIGKVFIFSS